MTRLFSKARDDDDDLAALVKNSGPPHKLEPTETTIKRPKLRARAIGATGYHRYYC